MKEISEIIKDDTCSLIKKIKMHLLDKNHNLIDDLVRELKENSLKKVDNLNLIINTQRAIIQFLSFLEDYTEDVNDPTTIRINSRAYIELRMDEQAFQILWKEIDGVIIGHEKLFLEELDKNPSVKQAWKDFLLLLKLGKTNE
jgi:hypothetical protein